MEATKEKTGGLLDRILPPCLEDAGLEDCALPPDSIKEAFFKAASFFHEDDDGEHEAPEGQCVEDPWSRAKDVKLRATSFFHEDDDGEPEAPEGQCVEDPWSRAKDVKDAVVGLGELPDTRGPRGAVKGGGVVEEGVDKVEVVGGGSDVADGDRLVAGGGDDLAEGENGGGCVGGEKRTSGGKEEKKKDRGSDGNLHLVEGFA